MLLSIQCGSCHMRGDVFVESNSHSLMFDEVCIVSGGRSLGGEDLEAIEWWFRISRRKKICRDGEPV